MQTQTTRITLRFTVVLIAALFLFGNPALTAARQDAAAIGPVTPAPADCIVDARTADSVIAIFAAATPVADPAASPDVTIPLGDPAETAVVTEITSLIHQAFACLNAGDYLRFLNLLTDQAVVTNFSWVGEMIVNGELPSELTEPVAMNPDSQQTILGIGAVTQVADGSITAVVVFIDPSAEEAVSALHLTLLQDGDRWLIDRAIDFHND